MPVSPRTAATYALAATLLLGAAGCSTKSDSASGGGGGTASGAAVKTGPGVTGTTINLGMLTDLSGVFASQGKDITDGNVLFWDQQNAKGGVCGKYQVKLQTKDTGYVVQQAVQLYSGMHNDVLAIQQTLGSAINTALDQQLRDDKMVNVPAAWARNLTANPGNAIIGSTYDVEMINLVDYALKNGLLKDGDAVGHIYFEGEFGSNGLAGSKYMAGKHNLKVVEAKIKPTDSDMSAQVIGFKNAGVKAILMSASPTQLASTASVSAAQGLNVPILGNSPVFAPGVLKGPAGAAIKAHYIDGAPYAGFDKAPELLAAYRAKHPDQTSPSTNVVWGYAAADVLRQVLDKACQNGDLTREGVSTAKGQLSSVTTGGLVVPLDFSKPGVSPSQQSYIIKPSDDPGSLTTVTDAYQAADLADYKQGG